MKEHTKFKGLLFGFLVFVLLFLCSSSLFAEELKIIFTGQSYASLYPCSCPGEQDGGIARRATLIKKLRSASKNVLVLEVGSSFASGPQDQNTENYEIDARRTDIYLKSLKLMDYDALLVSSQEYAFGDEFLKRYSDLPFVSSNLQGFVRPYCVKDLGWVKVGILGLTDSLVASKGIHGWQLPAEILEQKISELKKKNADIVVLLSSLNLQQDRELLKNIKGVDVVINGSVSYGSVNLAEQEDGVLYLTTWWQAKKVAILTLEISKSKIIKKSLESVRLSPELTDDEGILAILPQCFRASDCKKVAGFISKCENGSLLQAQCIYIKQPKMSLTIIKPKSCRTCPPHIEKVIKALKSVFGDLKIDYLLEDDAAAKEFIQEFKMTMLPAYLFHKDIEKSGIFPVFSPNLDKGKNAYLLKPSRSGVSYVLGRQRIPKRLDVFFDLQNESLPKVFTLLKTFKEKHKDIDVHINFLAVQAKDGTLLSRGGVPEIEEFSRIACIDDLEPPKVFDYVICRSSQRESSWWDACVVQLKIDPSKIKKCALSSKGKESLLEHTKLTQELEIASGPTFIVDNKEIFAIVNVPSLEELEKVVLGGGSNENSQTK